MSEATRPELPTGSEPVEEIPLARAPLERVLCQVRFANLAVFRDEGYEEPFVRRLVEEYPILDQGQQFQLTFDPTGQMRQHETSGKVWLLRSIDRVWTVTLSPGSLALQTSSYTSRAEFIDRFAKVGTAFAATFGGVNADRIGIRYVNRVATSALTPTEVLDLTYSDTRGPLTPYALPDGGFQHALLDLLLHDADTSVQAKWGIVPPNMSYDPTVPSRPEESWFLDIDSFSSDGAKIGDASIVDRLEELARREYRLFRWIVTPTFLERFRE